MQVDPVTGAIPVQFGAETVELRFTNSAYAYVEQEAGVDCAQEAIARFMQGAMDRKVVFSMVIAFARAFLRAAKKDPDLVDEADRITLVAAVTALILSTLDLKPVAANPPEATASN